MRDGIDPSIPMGDATAVTSFSGLPFVWNLASGTLLWNEDTVISYRGNF